MSGSIDILVVDDGTADEQVIRALLSYEQELKLVDYVDGLGHHVPPVDVVVVACSEYGEAASALIRDAVEDRPSRPVVLITQGAPNGYVDHAFQAGAADIVVLPRPCTVGLAQALSHQVRFTLGKVVTKRSGAGAAEGKLVVLIGPKGGSGKTLTATNLAAALAKHHNKRTLLLDLDLQFGDAAIMLGLEPDKTIHDFVTAPGELDSDKLAGYTTRHASGLDILPAPLRPEDAELVTEAKLARLLEVARESFDLIVVDTSPFFHGPMLATLDRTDELLLLCALDVPTLKNVRLSLQTLELLSFPSDRIRVVLRRTSTKVGMKPREVEGALERKVAFEVPSDGAVPLAVNRGNPLVLTDGRSDFSKAIREMAKALTTSTATQKPRRRSFSVGRS